MAAIRPRAASSGADNGAARLAWTLCFALYAGGAAAIDEIVFTSGAAEGRGWSVEGVEARLDVGSPGAPSAMVAVSGLKLPDPLKPFRNVTARCARLDIDDAGLSCRGGELRLRGPEDAPAFSAARFDADLNERGLRIALAGLRVGGGVIEARFEATDERFSLSADARSLPLPDLLRIFEGGPAGAGVEAQSGAVSGTLRWQDGEQEAAFSMALDAEGVAFSDGAGLNAGENLAATLEVSASRRRGPWRFRVDATLPSGQIYLHPVFVDAGKGALGLTATGSAASDLDRVDVEHLGFRHHGVVAVEGSAALSRDAQGARLERLALATGEVFLEPFHAAYLEPWLVETVFSRLSATGKAAARIAWSRGGASDLSLTLEDVDLQDENGRFALLGLSGELHWDATGVPRPARLRFRGARFYRIDLGRTALAGTFAGPEFRLGAPLDLPLLGGALHIEEFEAAGLGGGQPSWRLRGRLEPISLEELTRRLDWPPFTGSLSGEIPSLRYAGGEISVDGKLSVRAFDGRAEVHGLRLEQPFGVVPRLTSNIVLENLSLGALTSAFSFGKIEGRLSGRIDDLVLENWRPAAFDAHFATPENDSSRHRISQRAVENLARIGGTAQVLSSTLLKFLESFSYDRLGISCRLQNGVCEMGGVADAERGYYIVKGGGLPPRIDVYGFNTRVDWSTLVERLKAITRANEAVVR